MTLQTRKIKFTIFSSDIQSINGQIDPLRLFIIDSLKTFNFTFSVFCIQESRLSEGSGISLIQLEGYECISQGNVCSSKEGIIYL